MRFERVAIETLAHALPEEVVSSAAIEARLAPLYERLKLPAGRLEMMTGIRERRVWPNGFLPSQASTRAARAALERTRFAAGAMDLLMHCAVCRDRLEPASAAYVHGALGLPAECAFLDVSNACLGFLNGMALAAGLIEAGQLERVLLVSGEHGRPLLEHTLARLLEPGQTRASIKPYFANLTIGSGAVAAVLCRAGLAPDAPRLRVCTSLSDTSATPLCQGGDAAGGGLEMQTDAEALLEAGVGLARKTWAAFCQESGWSARSPGRIICHQVGRRHLFGLYDALGLDREKDYSTFEWLGNIGSVSCPLTLAHAVDAGAVAPGDKVALLGIGSGLSCLMAAVEYPAY